MKKRHAVFIITLLTILVFSSCSIPSPSKVESPVIYIEYGATQQDAVLQYVEALSVPAEHDVSVIADTTNYEQVGEYSITFSVNNGKRIKEETCRLFVQDTIPPDILINGSISIGNQTPDLYTDLISSAQSIITATDNCDGEISLNENNLSCFADSYLLDSIGENEVEFVVTDSNGNSASCYIIVSVYMEPYRLSLSEASELGGAFVMTSEGVFYPLQKVEKPRLNDIDNILCIDSYSEESNPIVTLTSSDTLIYFSDAVCDERDENTLIPIQKTGYTVPLLIDEYGRCDDFNLFSGEVFPSGYGVEFDNINGQSIEEYSSNCLNLARFCSNPGFMSQCSEPHYIIDANIGDCFSIGYFIYNDYSEYTYFADYRYYALDGCKKLVNSWDKSYSGIKATYNRTKNGYATLSAEGLENGYYAFYPFDLFYSSVYVFNYQG